MGCGSSVPADIVLKKLAEDKFYSDECPKTRETAKNNPLVNTEKASVASCHIPLKYTYLVAGYELEESLVDGRINKKDYKDIQISVLEKVPRNETHRVVKWLDDTLQTTDANNGFFVDPERTTYWPDELIHTDAVRSKIKAHYESKAEKDEWAPKNLMLYL